MAVERILHQYPAALRHKGNDKMDAFDQVVYLKVECPSNGSVKTLCKDVIAKLDETLLLDYGRIYRVDRATEADLKKAVAHTLAMHRVGILVIDEIQNLTISHQSHEILFNFIVSLANSLETPVLYVGTPRVKKFMQHDLRVARRFGTAGSYRWGPLKFKEPEWNSFFLKLKELYVLMEPMDEKKVEKALFYHSQGIPGILVNLFLLAQIRAMVENKEKLTDEIVNRANALYFGHVSKMVEALRNSDSDELSNFPDICFMDDEMKAIKKKIAQELGLDESVDLGQDTKSAPETKEPATSNTKSKPVTSTAKKKAAGGS